MSRAAIDFSEIVVVIPSYNEGDRVATVVNEIKAEGFNRIVVVDDHSNDASIEKLKHYNVTLLNHYINRGAGAATETGFKYCREHLQFKHIITIDADTQHHVSDMVNLLEAHIQQKADITIGNRFILKENHIPALNIFYNVVANITTTILSGRKFSDSQSGFKAITKDAIHKIIIEQDKYEYCSELLIKAHKLKMKVIDVPIKISYPKEIKNKGQNFSHGVNTFMNLIHSILFKNN